MSPAGGGRYANQQIAGVAWTPASLTGVAEWWDFSDTSKITSSGGAVSAVATSLPSGGHSLVQATGGNKPLTGTDTLNGKNVIRFGSTTGMDASFSLAQPITVLAVTKATTAANFMRYIDGGVAGNRIIFYPSSNTWQVNATSAANTTRTATTGAHSHIIVFNGTSSAFYEDGTQYGGALSPGTAGINTKLNVSDYSETSGFQGDIAELVVVGAAVSSGDRASWATYIARWGL